MIGNSKSLVSAPKKEKIMKNILNLVSMMIMFQAQAQNKPTAQNPTCTVNATEKKLAGVAKNSFMQKCERDARTACENDAISQWTNGAAKEAHIKKCVREAVGS